MRVLIAEPSHVVSLLLSTLFQKHGFETHIVSTAEEALATLEHDRIGLLCLAYELGDMNGIDFVVTARKRELLLGQPVILFASTHDKKAIGRALRAGVTECFSKHQKDDLDKFIESFVAGKMHPIAVRVLLVEDSATNRKVIEALLEKQGVQVESVENGREALERITTGPLPDLVLMDCQMPVMDGYEAAQCIREWEQKGDRPRLPIIALTANAMRGDRDHCIVAGMSDYLAKPISPKALADTLARWLPGKIGTGMAVALAEDPVRQPAGSVFDAKTMLARFGGDREIAEIAVSGALDSIPGELSGLRHSCDSGDAATARRHAHTIKSLTASIAAAPCSALAETIEHLLADGAIHAAQQSLPHLEEYFLELSKELQDWIGAENQ